MKYASIDIETTGIDNERSQTLSIGIVLEDCNDIKPINELPKLEVAIIRERLDGEIFALNMNRDLISDILRYKLAKTDEERKQIEAETGREYLNEEDVVKRIFQFMFDHSALEGDYTFGDMREIVNGKSYPALTSKMPKWSNLKNGKPRSLISLVNMETTPIHLLQLESVMELRFGVI